MQKLVKLFEPGKIGKLKLKNRIILPPIGGMGSVTEPGGYVKDALIEFYGARARGGVGFIQLSMQSFGAAIQGPQVSGKPHTGPTYATGLLSVEDDEHIPSAQHFTKAIHSYGAKVSFSIAFYGIMLAHSLEKRPPETHPELIRVMGPSAVRDPSTGRAVQPLTVEEIKGLVQEAGKAAKRGKAAGFDAVRIQACHGYMIHQFLSPRANQRTDEYGGSAKNRCRFACEIIKEIRRNVGPAFPIIMRTSADDYIEGGIRLDEAKQQVPFFVEAGADAIDVSAGSFEARYGGIPTMYQPFGAMVHLAAAIKKVVDVPIIAEGKITPLLAERIITEGSADFINMGRGIIADPDLPNKVKEGRMDDIIPCIYCNQCLDRPGVTGETTRYCAVNPVVGRELNYKIEPAQQTNKVMVIGGGPAGMEAAITLAQRGHDTSLYEKNDKLGGQWNSISAFRPELNSLTKYLSREMKKAGVKVFLNKEVSRKLVQEVKPDAVVTATGAVPVVPDKIPGIQNKNVVLATDVLAGKVDVGQDVVVVGGRYVGLNTALFLAEHGKKVSIVSQDSIAHGVRRFTKTVLMQNLIKYGIRMFPYSSLESVTDKGINIVFDGGELPVKGGDRYTLLFIPADTVVLAVGSRSESRLGEQLSGIMQEVYSVGDCVEPRDVLAAIHEGSAVGRRI